MDELLVRHMTLLIKCMSDWTFLWPCYLSCVIKGQLLPYSTRFHLGLCLCDLYMWMELVPPLLFITRFLRALLQSSLSLQTLFWLFSEGGLHLYCQETIRPPRDIFLRAVLEPSIQSFAAALNICLMTCGSDFNGKGRVINEVPLQRGGRKKIGFLLVAPVLALLMKRSFSRSLCICLLFTFVSHFITGRWFADSSPISKQGFLIAHYLAWTQSRPNCVLTVSNVFTERAHTLQISGLSGDKWADV